MASQYVLFVNKGATVSYGCRSIANNSGVMQKRGASLMHNSTVFDRNYRVRPVVILKSNIKLKSPEKDNDDVWQLDVEE